MSQKLILSNFEVPMIWKSPAYSDAYFPSNSSADRSSVAIRPSLVLPIEKKYVYNLIWLVKDFFLNLILIKRRIHQEWSFKLTYFDQLPRKFHMSLISIIQVKFNSMQFKFKTNWMFLLYPFHEINWHKNTN